MIEILAQVIILFIIIAFSFVAIAGNLLKHTGEPAGVGAAASQKPVKPEPYVTPAFTLVSVPGADKNQAA